MYRETEEYLRTISDLPRDEFERKAKLYAEKHMKGKTDIEICRILSSCRR